MPQMGFFDLSDRYASLDAKKDPLVGINAVVPWEEFRATLERVWRKPDVVAPGPMQKEARMTRRKSKIADPRAPKGKGQLTMLRVMTHEAAAAAEQAGFDLGSVAANLVTHPFYRAVAGHCY